MQNPVPPQRTPDSCEEEAQRLDGSGKDDRYRLIFENAPVALYRTALDGTLLDANPALVALLRFPDRETLMAVNAADVYLDPIERQTWRQLMHREGRGIYEMRDRRYDGSLIWVRDTARVVYDGRGTAKWYEGTLEDITGRREGEKAARDSEERFLLLARHTEDVIWEWNFGTGEVVWHPMLREVFGYDPERVGPSIEHSYSWWRRRVHPEDVDRVTSGLHAAVTRGAESWMAEYRFRRLDGSYAVVLDRCYIGRGADGCPNRMIGAILNLERRAEPNGAGSTSMAVSSPPVPQTSDSTLVRWMANGSEQALEELYARHAVTLCAVAQSVTSSPDDAEEIAADVLLRAWSEAASYDPERGSVIAWLTRMSRSRALERRRKRRRRLLLFEAEMDGGSAQTSAVPTAAHAASGATQLLDRMTIAESLATLPDPQREVLELAYFRGHSHSEIADYLDWPLGTVKTRIRTGLAKLRARVTRQG